ncbi:MAG: efflux RND transporter permease subunit [Gammaproteobacteria bacterium]|nr:efflux RND transporter permease subunit [Gammaproteobacteria bacterium]
MLNRLLHNHVLANLAFALVLVLGAAAYSTMPREQDPEINFNWIDIHTVLPGASAVDVELQVTDVLEDAIRNVSDIKFVSSVSRAAVSSILVRFEDIDTRTFDKRVNDLRRELQAVQEELPEETVDPRVSEITTDNAFPSVILAVTSTAEDENLRRQSRIVKEDLQNTRGVSSVLASGLHDPELIVDFDPDLLASRGVSPTQVADTVAAYYRDTAAGSAQSGSESWLVRLQGTDRDPEYLAGLPLVGMQGEIRLDTVASVQRARSRPERLVRYRGQPAVLLSVTKKAGTNTLQLVDRVSEYVAERNALSGETGVDIVLINDQTEITRSALRIMQTNALLGLGLVLVVTWLFLGNRIALLTCIGIPFILMGTFWFLSGIGQTLNVTVLLGVVISLGMLVDDAVVVAEAIFYRLERGAEVVAATFGALREVMAPVTTAVLTTMAAFLPLMLLPGILGKFMLVIPLVVTTALAISLMEAYWMLPVHVIGGGVRSAPRVSFVARLRDAGRAFVLPGAASGSRTATSLLLWLPRFAWRGGKTMVRVLAIIVWGAVSTPLRILDALDGWASPYRTRAMHWIRIGYTRILVKVLRYPRRTLTGVALLLVLALGFVVADSLPEEPPDDLTGRFVAMGMDDARAGRLAAWLDERYPRRAIAWLGRHALQFDFFASDPIRLFYINVEMPIGTPLSETMHVVQSIETRIGAAVHSEELRAMVSYSGIMFTETAPFFGDRYGQIVVSLRPKTPQLREVDAVIDAVRPVVQDVPGTSRVSILRLAGGPPTTRPVSVKIRGNDLARIRTAADELKSLLDANPALRDVTDDATAGQRTLTVKPDLDALRRAGVDPRELSRATRLMVDGEVVAAMQDQGEKLEVRVRAQPRPRDDIARILDLRLPGTNGSAALRDLVQLDFARTPEAIRHHDYRRTVTVEADIDKSLVDELAANRIATDAWETLRPRYPDLSIDQSGLLDDIQESLDAIGVLFLIGVGLMYMIVGTQFKSYLQPIMILVAIPLAGVGVVAGLIVSGNPLSLFTLYGVVALAGIAVNAAIVLISAANARLSAGMSVLHATIYAGRRRVVPIIITSLTTVAGLFSLATGLGGHSLLWGPVAAAIVWGLVFSTLLTLLIVPLLYRLSMDNSHLVRDALKTR